jgi:hypothetical protein
VATQPLDPDVGWAVDCCRLTASAGDREIVIDSLRAACAQGRLSKDELDRRAIQVLESRTRAGLVSATAGIPPATAGDAPAIPVVIARTQVPTPTRATRWKVIAWLVGLAIVLPAVSVAFVATRYGSFFILLSIGAAAAAALGSPIDLRRHSR